jgi:hypothetical protein
MPLHEPCTFTLALNMFVTLPQRAEPTVEAHCEDGAVLYTDSEPAVRSSFTSRMSGVETNTMRSAEGRRDWRSGMRRTV